MPRRHAAAFFWAAFLIGFALSGFFDGILLHQILQWHHLLSLVEGAGGIEAQILYDGLFHALMYVIAVVGLWLLWRGRREFGEPGAGRLAFAFVLIGFGTWNIIDVALAHWVLVIHRVRLETANPLAWDLAWIVAFGIVPLVLGLLLRRRTTRTFAPTGGHSAALALALAVPGAGWWAAQPPADARSSVAVFRPGLSDGQVLTAIHSAGGRLLWRSGSVWAIAWRGQPQSSRLYARGALLVSSSLAGAGCLAWSRA